MGFFMMHRGESRAANGKLPEKLLGEPIAPSLPTPVSVETLVLLLILGCASHRA